MLNSSCKHVGLFALLAFGLVCSLTESIVEAGQLSAVIFHVEATNADGTGSYEFVDPDPTFTDGVYNWSLQGTTTILSDDQTEIAVLESATVTAMADPVIALNFAVSSGGSPTTFTISSPLLSFPTISPAIARSSASITATDNSGDGSFYTGGYVGGTKSFQADINGFVPGGTLFANLIGNGAMGTAFGSVTGSEDSPFGGGFASVASVSSMSTQYMFTVGAGDGASGTSTFVVLVPEPTGMVLVLMGSFFLLWRRR